MNKLKAEISDIITSGELSLISLNVNSEKFSSLIVNQNESYICKGNTVYMVFKETEVSIAKNLSGDISIRNRFPSVIKSIDKGQLLSEIKLDFKGAEISSIITTGSCERLGLKPGDEVEGLLKTTELLLMRYE
jgi:molybdate transport system regulatory protein